MFVVIIVGFVAIFFAWLQGRGLYKNGLKISFSFIFLFLALRFNFGSDYPEYLKLFKEVNIHPSLSIFDNFWKAEPGWIFLNRLCRPIGFFGMTIVLAVLNCYVYYKFFRKFVPPKYYWLAFFLYIFDVSFMMTQLSGYRQNISILLFIFAFDYLYKKDILRYVICIGIGAYVHISSLLLFPIFLLGYLNFKVNRKIVFIIILSYIALFVFIKDLLAPINSFISLYFDKYEIYENNIRQIGSGIGVVLTSFLFITIAIYSRLQKKENLLLFKIAMLGFLVIPLSIAIPSIGRVGMYFQPALLVVYPLMMSQIKNSIVKYLLLLIILLLTLYNFKLFFENPLWMKSVINYQTILSASKWF